MQDAVHWQENCFLWRYMWRQWWRVKRKLTFYGCVMKMPAIWRFWLFRLRIQNRKQMYCIRIRPMTWYWLQANFQNFKMSFPVWENTYLTTGNSMWRMPTVWDWNILRGVRRNTAGDILPDWKIMIRIRNDSQRMTGTVRRGSIPEKSMNRS